MRYRVLDVSYIKFEFEGQNGYKTTKTRIAAPRVKGLELKFLHYKSSKKAKFRK